MSTPSQSWLETLRAANSAFRQRIQADQLPVQREPCPYALITCMDPRVNTEAFGIPPFAASGASASNVRIIRTIGAMAEMRSLVIGIHLAGFKEVAIVMHTDCGCCLAYERIDTIIDNLQRSLRAEQWQQLHADIGDLFRENLMRQLKVFQDPRDAVRAEVESLRQQPYVPDTLIVHGLVYELATGQAEVVVNGYEA